MMGIFPSIFEGISILRFLIQNLKGSPSIIGKIKRVKVWIGVLEANPAAKNMFRLERRYWTVASTIEMPNKHKSSRRGFFVSQPSHRGDLNGQKL